MAGRTVSRQEAFEHVAYGWGARPGAHCGQYSMSPDLDCARMRGRVRVNIVRYDDDHNAEPVNLCDAPADGWVIYWTHEC
jgi:hypothetical protein